MELMKDHTTMMNDSGNLIEVTTSLEVKNEPTMEDKISMPSLKRKVSTKDELLYKEEIDIHWDESDNRASGTINENSAFSEQNCIILKDEQGQLIDILQPSSNLTACPNCYKILSSSETFESHLKVCEQLHNYVCDKCSFVTWNRDDFKRHKYAHAKMESSKHPRISEQEKSSLPNSCPLDIVDIYSCKKCAYTCEEMSMLKSHIKLHSTATKSISKSVRRKKTIPRPKNANDVANQGAALVSAKSLYAKLYDNIAEQDVIANSWPQKVQNTVVHSSSFQNCNQDYNEMKELFAEITKQQVKVTKVCRECNITTEFDVTDVCKMCDRKSIFQCNHCSRQFENYKKVSYHSWTQCNIKGYYQCLKCDFKSPYKFKVHFHCDKHHPEICDPLGSAIVEKYIEYKAFQSNAQEASSPANTCAICDMQFEQSVEFDKHLNHCRKIQQIMEVIKWNGIASRAPPTSILEASNSIVALPEYFVQYCVKCNKDSELESFMLRRLKPCKDCNNSTMFYKCSKCSKLCKSYYDGCKHSINLCHSQESPTKLDHTVSHRSKTKDHNQEVHDEGSGASLESYCTNCCVRSSVALCEEKCRKCKKMLHFTCQICKQFLVKGNDSKACEHIKRALGILKFECQCCGKIFSTKDELDIHMNSCTPLPYKCQFCDYISTAKIDVEAHERKVHPREKKIFQCNVCSREYPDKIEDLKKHILHRHVRLVRGKNVPPCTRCGWDLKGTLGLEKHLAYCGKKLYMQCRVNLTRVKVKRSIE